MTSALKDSGHAERLWWGRGGEEKGLADGSRGRRGAVTVTMATQRPARRSAAAAAVVAAAARRDRPSRLGVDGPGPLRCSAAQPDVYVLRSQ